MLLRLYKLGPQVAHPDAVAGPESALWDHRGPKPTVNRSGACSMGAFVTACRHILATAGMVKSHHEVKEIATMCMARSKPIAVHNTHAIIGTAASLHFCASTANSMYPQTFIGHRDELHSLFGHEQTSVDGR